MLCLFLLCVALTSVFAGDPPSNSECADCYQLPPGHSDGPDGACCYGTNWVKCSKENDCLVLGFVWAGPYTDAASCKHLKPCCYGNGTCADAVCFDCVINGGTPIERCDNCNATEPTTTTTKCSKHTKPTHTHTFTEPTTTPNGPDDGCCCLPDGSDPILTSATDCHDRGGIYRGDGSSCDTENVCQVKCCDPVLNVCIPSTDSKSQCEDQGGVFHGVGTCDSETCGGACCVAGSAVLSFSESDCSDRGGVFQGFQTALDDTLCPRACCVPGQIKSHCEMLTVAACLEVSGGGTPFNAGDTCRNVKCSGACCFDGEQSESSSVDSQNSETFGPSTCTIIENSPAPSAASLCEDQGGVYQGDGSDCPFTDDSSDSGTSSHTSSTTASSSSEDDDDDDTSGESTATVVLDNGQCLNDGACCLRDIQDGDENGCVRVGSIAQCVAKNGTFQGIGSRCTDRKICKKSACCLGEQGGCIDVHIGTTGEVECRLKGGRYVGDGTTCSLPGMCDHHSGACCCDGMCLNMPNATTCYNYGGCSFRGTGTDCCHEGLCDDFQKHEGACCIQNSYLEDGAQCVIMPNAIACSFRGGVWRGKNSNCDNADYTCGPLTGVCCIDGVAYDDQTASECKRCGGTFAGPGSCSGDEGVCDHRGACCKKGHGCEDATYAQCKRIGGNFQGPGTCCNDRDICTPCEPCNVVAPACASDADCEDESVCVAQFGKCMVAASRIPQKRHWNPISHASAMRLHVVPKAKMTMATSKNMAEHHERDESSSSSSSSSSSDQGGNWRHDDDLPDGPFSCGSNLTIGRPCILHPCSGKCSIGVCSAPPADTVSNACESICMGIHEYDCNCECRDPWWQTCAFIAGATYNDTDSDNTLDIDIDELFTETSFDVQLFSIPENGDSDVLVDTKTSTDGRYSFSQLAGGTYRVVLDVPTGYRIEDGNGPEQIITVTCLPPGDTPPTDITKRNALAKGMHSQVLTVVNSKSKSSHIVDNVYYLIAPGTPNNADAIVEEPVLGQPANLVSPTTSGTIIAVIVIGIIVLCLGALVFAFLSSQRIRSRPINSQIRNRIVTRR